MNPPIFVQNLSNRQYVYDVLIDLLQKLHKEHPDKDYDRKALEIFERKQGRVLLEEMGKSGARRFAGVPDDIKNGEENLENQIEQTHKRLVDERSKPFMEQNKELIQTLEQDEDSLKAEQADLEKTIKADYPAYHALKYPEPVSLADFQQNVLQPGELMLIYGVMEEQTVLWVVGQEEFKLFSLDIKEAELQREVGACFTLTETSFQMLKEVEMPDKTLTLLHDLQDQEICSVVDFLKAVQERIGVEQTAAYHNNILRHVEKQGFRAVPDAIIKALDNWKKLVALEIVEETLDDMAHHGYDLYQRLIPETVRPLIADVQMLYIVPTGPLYGLPFEALVVEDPKILEKPQYLLEKTPIAYLSSASLLKILRDAQARREQTAQYPLLAFAHPVYEPTSNPSQEGNSSTTPSQEGNSSTTPSQEGNNSITTVQVGNISIQEMRSEKYLTAMGGSTFKELEQTEQAARGIVKILEAPEESDPLQLRERASRSTVLEFNTPERRLRLDAYRYLLFLAHAVLPGEVGYLSPPAIVLSHPDPKTQKEGYLTMADAFGLKLNADLVALPACNTGRGEHIGGEGIIGLTRAFMYAGTPAVEVTLWTVFTGASQKLNTHFFERLKAGDSLTIALQKAKLEMLDEHPVFWAPFVVFGDGRISRQ